MLLSKLEASYSCIVLHTAINVNTFPDVIEMHEKSQAKSLTSIPDTPWLVMVRWEVAHTRLCPCGSHCAAEKSLSLPSAG